MVETKDFVEVMKQIKLNPGDVLIVGVKNGKSKAGKDNQTIHYLKNFSDYDVDSSDACFGFTAQSAYIGKRFDVKPGDIVKLEYEPGFEGKAVLVGITKKS